MIMTVDSVSALGPGFSVVTLVAASTGEPGYPLNVLNLVLDDDSVTPYSPGSQHDVTVAPHVE